MRRRRSFRGTALGLLAAVTFLALAPPFAAASDDPGGAPSAPTPNAVTSPRDLDEVAPSPQAASGPRLAGALAVASVGPGEALRYRDAQGPWKTVKFVSFTDDGGLLVQERGADPVTLDPRHLRLSFQDGTRGHTGTGFLVGASIGALLGATADNTSDEGLIEVEFNRAGLVFTGAAFLGLIGGVFGTMVRTPEWREVQLLPQDEAVLHGNGLGSTRSAGLELRADLLRLDW